MRHGFLERAVRSERITRSPWYQAMIALGHNVHSAIVRPEHVALRTSYERRNTIAGNSDRSSLDLLLQ